MISGLEIDYEPPGLTVSSEEPDMFAVDVNDTLTLSQSEHHNRYCIFSVP